ncbi:LysR family transcriptional regulator [Intestinirhabdus alba]|jgi:DNA-binding transcriptional LysR family regulator|uniref:LysR family transcriptional regulator n=1 Tax=Intestinirhabdus alba TaxID=2899544 RepID=A0A6L6IKM0_9ENTR|nr:LysR family transcriptional regulator [Intestinirhabdus alba]MTH45253.1 LysR family transcriptional regulator [Intestinirhabdus alba]
MQNQHHLELTWLEDCIALADTLNFSRAAALRYVTQPAFSRRIQSLEEWLGTTLFERNRRGVTLTRAGEIFVKQAPDLIRSLYMLRDETLEAAGNAKPDIIFSATHSLSFSFFPNLLRNNKTFARFCSFRLMSDSLTACERMLIQGDAHFLLCYYHPHMHINLEQEKFLSIRLGQDILRPYTGIDPHSGQPVWMPGNKRKFSYLSFSAESGLGRIISNSAAVNKIKRGMKIEFVADLAATLLAMIKDGDGVAWLPQKLAEADVQNGSICPAAPEHNDLNIPVEIRLYRPATKMTGVAEELWEQLVSEQNRAVLLNRS